ncbi:MAG: TlpA family protein disulfide reductase [Pirellulales bacterium]|nr:TlpA family protein disulfide reductase [Pirellulales bacterium]
MNCANRCVRGELSPIRALGAVAVLIGVPCLAPLRAAEPVAADLVRAVIDQEAAIDRVASLHLRLEATTVLTPAGLEEFFWPPEEPQFPQMRTQRRLGVRSKRSKEFAYDRARIMCREQAEFSRQESVWDGQRFVGHVQQFDRATDKLRFEQFQLARTRGKSFEYLWLDVGCFRTGAHPFWWYPDEPRWTTEVQRDLAGLPEDYELVGRERLAGRDCWVVLNRWRGKQLHIGIDDGRLHACTVFVRPRGVDLQPDHYRAASNGAAADGQAWAQWVKSLDEHERFEASRRLAIASFDQWTPMFRFSMDDYREVAPGFWFPFANVAESYLYDRRQEPPLVGRVTTTKIVELAVNQPLDDARFALEPVEGAEVYDATGDLPLRYKFKRSYSPEEWAAIVAEHQARDAQWKRIAAAQHELVGQAAPALPQSHWLNGPPRDWDALRGKVVLLEFWGTFCGPCRNDFGLLNQLHAGATDGLYAVVAVHTADDDVEMISSFLTKEKLAYPVCVDAPAAKDSGGTFGELSAALRVHGVPHTVVVDRDGRIAATGMLHEVLPKFHELVGKQ